MLHKALDFARGWLRLFFGQRWVRFGIMGGISTAVYAALGLAFAWWNWPVLFGNAVAYILSFVVSYIGQKNWTFASRLPHSQLLPKFAAVQGAGLLLNTAIIALLMHFGLPYMFAMPVAIVSVPVFVYVVSKLWVFRTSSSHAPVSAPVAGPVSEPDTASAQGAGNASAATSLRTSGPDPLAATPSSAGAMPPSCKPEP